MEMDTQNHHAGTHKSEGSKYKAQLRALVSIRFDVSERFSSLLTLDAVFEKCEIASATEMDKLLSGFYATVDDLYSWFNLLTHGVSLRVRCARVFYCMHKTSS